MPSTYIDSEIFKNNFSTEEYRKIFNEKSIIQSWLDVEAALAAAEAEMGIISREAAEEINRIAVADNYDSERIREDMAKLKHTIMPIVKAMKSKCSGEAGEYVHWGATTQDITDTGVILQVKQVYELLERDINELLAALIEKAEKYKSTVMCGRTHGQQALPITFGYKASIWIMELCRHKQRLLQAKPRILTGLLSGAVGTLAAFGPKGREVQRRALEILGLNAPVITWHTSRDNVTEFVYILTLISATCAKIAKETYNLSRTEISELEEPFTEGKVGSSTMPHKRNPSSCERILGLEKFIRGCAGVMGEGMTYPDHERAMRIAEWPSLSEACMMTGAVLFATQNLVKGMTVREERMKKNLNVLNGLLLTERVMFVVADKIGRQSAHDIVYKISMKSFEQDIPFIDALMADEYIAAHITRAELEEALDPQTYTGLAEELVEDVLNYAKTAKP